MMVLKTSLALQQRGLGLTLVCYPNSTLHQQALQNGVHCHAMAFTRGPHPRLILRLRTLIRKQRFDVLHTHFSRDLRFLVPACTGLRPRIPLLLTKRVGSYIRKKDFVHQYLYARVDRVLAISRVIKENLLDTCPLTPEQVQLHYNGLDLQTFDLDEYHRQQVRRQLHYAEPNLVIGMVGRFSPGKGHEAFLDAARLISASYPQARFLIVGGASHGEDAYYQEIVQLCEHLGLKQRVHFTGFRTDIAALLSAMDILVFPSRAEAFGNVVIEAMAMLRPVIAGNTDGVLDIVEDGVNGLLFRSTDATDLARKLSRLADDRGLRLKIGAAGRQTVEQKFEQNRQIGELINIYQELIRCGNGNSVPSSTACAEQIDCKG